MMFYSKMIWPYFARERVMGPPVGKLKLKFVSIGTGLAVIWANCRGFTFAGALNLARLSRGLTGGKFPGRTDRMNGGFFSFFALTFASSRFFFQRANFTANGVLFFFELRLGVLWGASGVSKISSFSSISRY